MKTGKKALLLALCAVLLVAATVMGTMAYLTSTDTVTNTFTIGNVNITLDETKVDVNGKPEEPTSYVKSNEYKLMPGHSYTKDPTVHVTAGSENSWIFVKVENGISAFEAATVASGYTSIADQVEKNGWTKLTGVEGVDNVYYKEYTKSNTQDDLKVFENFKIADEANKVTGWDEISKESTKITITAYAIQKDGFTTAAAAWAEVSK